MLKGIMISILAALVVMIIFLGYILFINFYSVSNFKAVYPESKILINSSVEQFYPNMRFKNSEISYSIGKECNSGKVNTMKEAFMYFENRTNLKFYETGAESEIEVRCGEEYEKSGLFIAGEGGPTTIINGTLFNVILNGQVLLLYSKPPCLNEKYNVELHELLHALGFEHSQDSRNIMYNISYCGQSVSEETIKKLNELYSVESLSDLYLKDVFAVKKGSYLNLNFSIFNQGLAEARNVKVELETGNEKFNVYNFSLIGIGEGRIFWVENMKIPYNTKTANLSVDDGKELNYGNNKVILILA